MAELKLGRKAPAFTLKDKDGKKISLNKVEAEFTVIYFYPKDNTPGCTIEAHEFNLLRNKFKKLDTAIIGISGGDQKSKEKFCSKNKLKIDLLSDPDFKISDKYGVYGEKSFMGRKFQGIYRKTFVLNESKKIIKIYDKVKPLVHAKEVLDFIRTAGKE